MKQLNAAQTSPTQVLAMVQVLDEMDAIYTPVMKRGRSESVRANDVAQRYGHAMTQALQRYCRDEIEFWCRCKRAALLYDWIEGTPVDVLEKRFSTTPFGSAIGYGNIIGIADATRFHLRSRRTKSCRHCSRISPRSWWDSTKSCSDSNSAFRLVRCRSQTCRSL